MQYALTRIPQRRLETCASCEGKVHSFDGTGGDFCAVKGWQKGSKNPNVI